VYSHGFSRLNIFFKYCLTSTKASSFRCYHTKYIVRLTAKYFYTAYLPKSAGLLEKMLWLTSLIDLLIERSGTGLSQTASRISIIWVQFPEGKALGSDLLLIGNAENCFFDERVMSHAWYASRSLAFLFYFLKLHNVNEWVWIWAALFMAILKVKTISRTITRQLLQRSKTYKCKIKNIMSASFL